MVGRSDRPGHHRAARTVLALAVVALGACSATGGEPRASAPTGEVTQAACDLLAEETTLQGAGPAVPLPADRVVEVLLAAADHDLTTTTVYLEPSQDDADLAAFAAELAERPGVRSVRTTDRAATYDDFRRMFADQPTMLERVTPEDLPVSATAVIASDEADALEDWARARSTTFEVRTLGDSDLYGDLARWLVREDDRAALADLGAQLERVDGTPTWAVAAAQVIDGALEDGPAGVSVDPALASDAVVALDEQLAAC